MILSKVNPIEELIEENQVKKLYIKNSKGAYKRLDEKGVNVFTAILKIQSRVKNSYMLYDISSEREKLFGRPRSINEP